MGRMIGLLQVDPTVGDLTGNAQRLEHLAHLASQNGAEYWRHHGISHFRLPAS